MITRREANMILREYAIVDDGFDTVRASERRNCAELAIAEEKRQRCFSD